MVENHRQANDAHRLRHHRCGQCRRERPAGGCGDTERARPCPHRTVTPLQSRSRMVENHRQANDAHRLRHYRCGQCRRERPAGGCGDTGRSRLCPTEQLPALDFTPADGSITTPKLADDAVTSSKIAYGAIVNNIGYTPLGTKGDQAIDGTLNVRYWLHIRNPNDSALRSVHHNDGTIGFVGPRGWMARFGDDGNLWTPIFGWLSNTLNAKLGAQGDQKIEGALTVRSSLFLYDPGNHTTRMLRNWANELQLGPSNAYAVAIHDDGTLWSRAYGQLHDYFARKSELNTKQPAGNYVMGINNRYLLKWDNGLHA